MSAIVAIVAFVFLAAPPALAAPPCCGITAINARTGIVTAKVNATGQTFQFKASPQTISSLKVGQGVYANFKTQQISVDGLKPCCSISSSTVLPPDGVRGGVNLQPTGVAPVDGVRAGTSVQPSGVAPVDGVRAGTSVQPTGVAPVDGVRAGASVQSTGVLPPSEARATANVKPANGEPCCRITAINARTGIVTAKVNATGKTFQFTLNNGAQLSQLKLGQAIYANMAAKQVSLDGKNIVGVIATLQPPNGSSGIVPPETFAPPASTGSTGLVPPSTFAPPSAAGNCCWITAINSAQTLVTAKIGATGQFFTFRMTDPAQLKQLHIGQGVYASFAKNQVSLDGTHAVGTITSPPMQGSNTH